MNALVFSRPPPRYRVPHDRVGIRLIIAAHLAVTRAFDIIRREAKSLAAANENQVTELLEDVLENRIRNRGLVESFDTGSFGPVSRGSEVVNYNGAKISKKPDLIFKLRREHRTDWDQRQDALFAECKPVDKNHKLKDHYCAVAKDCTGIERFVIGDYAWAMEEALMIGYVRDGLQIDPHLAEALQDPVRRLGLGNPTPLETTKLSGPDGGACDLHQTTHQRIFSWASGEPASPIILFHSWHDCA